MDYADGLKDLLVRKINRAEQELVQLKMDYCRFVFGLTHRSRVQNAQGIFLVRAVDVESMQRTADGFTRPHVSGVPATAAADVEPIELGDAWTLIGEA
ncbi:MAG: hypothetical protein LPK85_13265 [Gammaproteobacteria bacterium]|nr:hypothetical protein [Gammaproteobacteria bacterium]